MTAHNNLGKYSQKGKMGTSVALQRMVRTTNTHRTYSGSRVLTSCYEKLMVCLKKKAALKFFTSTMNPGLAKTLLMCVCRVIPVCIYDVCFLTNTLQITKTFFWCFLCFCPWYVALLHQTSLPNKTA